MKIPKYIIDLIKKVKYHQLATCSRDKVPNVCTFGAYFIKDDETIIIVDNYMKKTYKNVTENNEIAILVKKDSESYQLKGKCAYKNKGREYEKYRKMQKQKDEKYPAKGILIIKIVSIYDSRPGKNAGKKLIF